MPRDNGAVGLSGVWEADFCFIYLIKNNMEEGMTRAFTPGGAGTGALCFVAASFLLLQGQDLSGGEF